MRPLSGPGAAARAGARTALYVHVPFCAAPCPYCHFSKEHLSGAAVERWLAALEREAALRAPAAAGLAFSSVFFGGGTPSAIAPRAFARAWGSIRDHFTLEEGAEITLEANPETVKPGLLDAWAQAGVNRLSMGAQSFVPEELRALGRLHDEKKPGEAFALARAHGFRRLSLDLMFGYPGHTAATWERTLAAALALEPEHISAYGYIPEEGTPLGDAVHGGAARTVSPELEAELHVQADAAFAAAGLVPYETSNWSRPGAECRHNLTYWLRRDYLALGPSSHGLWRGERYENVRAMPDWATALEQGHDPAVAHELETPASRADETVMLALRLASGLDLRDLSPDPREELEMRYGRAFADAQAGGRLERTAHGWRIPAAHRFVADDTIAWLAVRARPLPARERAA
ncbi:MAG TPA: radical SAM family heme chaperone HemW [Methylomirabilota bacterium]|nr:radical SAM family heme chaperone HemW [Methylomirabilota bacterium]